MIGFEQFTFSYEIFFLTVIIVVSFLFWSWALFLRLFLEVSFSLSKRRINFLIYLVGMPFLLSLKMGIFIISLILLKPFSKIIVEAYGYRD
jgi:hypothetical protein